jgi:dTDP-4-amino-4,6-dideoxygalactose transaminase
MAIPFLDLQAQYRSLKDQMAPAIAAVLDKTAYVGGPAVENFEKEFAAYCGVAHCITLHSGTGALSLLMQAHGIGPGDEVITVANSFFASAEAISNIGATPVLIDCEEATALMDPTKIAAAITPKTKAIVPVHMYGQCADIDAIMDVAKKRNVLVFEDACQAHGATYKGKRAGSLAHGAAFSFYPGKNLGAYGEGGAAVTNDPGIAQTLKMLRDHGSRQKYHHELVGWNERLDALQCAVLTVKLPHLDGWNAARRENAHTYQQLLKGVVQMFTEQAYGEPVYHLFVIRHTKRDALIHHLKEKGIGTNIHYPIPIHMQPAYKGRWKQGQFPVSEKLASEVISLPMFAEITKDQIEEVANAIKAFV